MNELSIFDYEENKVSFSDGDGNVMVNATEMARPFGKRPVDWLKTDASKEFIYVLGKVKKFTLDEIVIVRYGGSSPGTWFHEDVALEFARWLSPMFAIWCNDRIKELLMRGHVDLRNVSSVRSKVEELYGDSLRLMQDNKWKKEDGRYRGDVDFGYGDVYPFFVRWMGWFDVRVLTFRELARWTSEDRLAELFSDCFIYAKDIPKCECIQRYVGRFFMQMGVPYAKPKGRRLFAIELKRKKDIWVKLGLIMRPELGIINDTAITAVSDLPIRQEFA